MEGVAFYMLRPRQDQRAGHIATFKSSFIVRFNRQKYMYYCRLHCLTLVLIGNPGPWLVIVGVLISHGA